MALGGRRDLVDRRWSTYTTLDGRRIFEPREDGARDSGGERGQQSGSTSTNSGKTEGGGKEKKG